MNILFIARNYTYSTQPVTFACQLMAKIISNGLGRRLYIVPYGSWFISKIIDIGLIITVITQVYIYFQAVGTRISSRISSVMTITRQSRVPDSSVFIKLQNLITTRDRLSIMCSPNYKQLPGRCQQTKLISYHRLVGVNSHSALESLICLPRRTMLSRVDIARITRYVLQSSLQRHKMNLSLYYKKLLAKSVSKIRLILAIPCDCIYTSHGSLYIFWYKWRL